MLKAYVNNKHADVDKSVKPETGKEACCHPNLEMKWS